MKKWSKMERDIYVLEDDKAISETLSILLESKGYSSVVFDDGADGLEAIVKAPPALVILDLYLPGKNGLEVFMQMRAAENTINVPVIFLSSLTKQQIKLTLGEASELIPEEMIMPKPISPTVFMKKVEQLLSPSTT